MINWEDPDCKVTPHFTVKDCLFLFTWGRLAKESDGLTFEICDKLAQLCNLLEVLRVHLGVPMQVTSMFRPPAYSPLVGGTSHDVHTMGIACDFIPEGLEIEDAKVILRPLMESLNFRIERGTTTWIHVDTHIPGPSGREFVP